MKTRIKLSIYISALLALSAVALSATALAAPADTAVVDRSVRADTLTLKASGENAVVNAGGIGTLVIDEASPKNVRICGGVDNLVISGSGKTVTVASGVSSVTVSGQGNTAVVPWGGRVDSLSLTQDSRDCSVTVFTSPVSDVELQGQGNVIRADSRIGDLVLGGVGCSVTGSGSVDSLVRRTYRSDCGLTAGSDTDQRPTGLGDLDMELQVPETIAAGDPLPLRAELTNPFKLDCRYTWYVNDFPVGNGKLTVGPEKTELRADPNLIFDDAITESSVVRLAVTGKNASGDDEMITGAAPLHVSDLSNVLKNASIELVDTGSAKGQVSVSATVSNDIPSICSAVWCVNGKPMRAGRVSLGPEGTKLDFSVKLDPIPASGVASVELRLRRGDQTVTGTIDERVGISAEEALATVTHKYAGDRTLEWAMTHDYDDNTKTVFVNAKGYESATDRLVWVNLTYQRVNVFRGSKGNWVLEKTFLCGTGASGSGTPVGEYTVWYSQPNGWNHGSYIVRPVVRFNVGSGYAFHSRLWNPSHTRLVDDRIGFPISAGCVRMYDEDAYWMLENITEGTKVVIH